ncbi:MAG: DNA polymerase IV [Gemmatimonadota bacterium]
MPPRLSTTRAILHVDLDAFFVAVERLADPALAGRPVVVGADPQHGRGRGVVAAASYEARAFGIRSAMPIGEAYRRCPDAVYLPGQPVRYAQAARAVRRIFRRFTPLVEPVSIDEAYLDLTGTERLHGPPERAAERLRGMIHDELRLPVSMGLGATRTVAKVASELAKPAGFLHVWPGREAAFLAPLPVGRLPGIGPVTRARLAQFNLRTLGELARFDPVWLDALFGGLGVALGERASGGGDGPGERLLAAPGLPRSISRECTFAEDTADPAYCDAVLVDLGERAARELRAQRLTARTVVLKLRYRDFTTVTRRTTLATPTDSDRVVAGAARELFRSTHARRVQVRLLGVALTNLTLAAPQLDLFSAPRALAWERLLGPLDRLRARYGEGVVRSGPTLVLDAADHAAAGDAGRDTDGALSPPWRYRPRDR